MLSSTPIRLADLVFYTGLLLVAVFFFWSRVNTSDYLYFVGDGTLIVALVEEMLKSGDWTADIGRIAHTINLQEEWQSYTSADLPEPGGHYFNLAGYTVIATAVCRAIQLAGLDGLSIPFMLHGLNVLLQGLTAVLLFAIGQRMAGRNLGLLIVVFFTLLPLAITEAHYERPESWLALLTTIMLFALLRYEQSPRRNALIIGVALGLSLSVKFSQLFLGLIPLCLFTCKLFETSAETFAVKGYRVMTQGAMLCLGLIIAVVINVPFVLQHLPDYFHEVSITSGFFDTPHPLYALEYHDYFSQLGFISRYFLGTLGVTGCAVLVLGAGVCFYQPVSKDFGPWHYLLSLCLPPLFILFYFSLKYNFMERIFSATEPMLCILSGMGVYACHEIIKKIFDKKWLVMAAMILLIALAAWKPLELDYRFVQHHIRHAGYQPRIDFQENLKKDFAGFWIKNVHITAGFLSSLPEIPGKAPRIYQFEDYNQYWTAPHFEKLKANGFVQIATYCSDFHDLPASNYTIYHAAAKNHYFVRQDEWPQTVAQDYFRTNCP